MLVLGLGILVSCCRLAFTSISTGLLTIHYGLKNYLFGDRYNTYIQSYEQLQLQLHYNNHKSTQVERSKMSFTKNLTRALNTTPLRQQRSTTTFPYATHEPLEYQLSRLSLSKIKQESARPEPDLRHVVGYASVNRAAGDKMYQNLVRGVELLRTERRAKYAAGRSKLSSSSSNTSSGGKGNGAGIGGLGVLRREEEVVETRCFGEGELEGRGRRRKRSSKRLREERV